MESQLTEGIERRDPIGFTFEDMPTSGSIIEFTDRQADTVTPVDLLSSENYTDKATRDARFAICKECDRLFKPTRTCKECGCFMAVKTWLKDATCALHDNPKW